MVSGASLLIIQDCLGSPSLLGTRQYILFGFPPELSAAPQPNHSLELGRHIVLFAKVRVA